MRLRSWKERIISVLLCCLILVLVTACSSGEQEDEKTSKKVGESPTIATHENEATDIAPGLDKELVGQWSSLKTIEGESVELIITLSNEGRFSFYEFTLLENDIDGVEDGQTVNSSATGTYTLTEDQLTLNYEEVKGGDLSLVRDWTDSNLIGKEVTYTYSVDEHRLKLINTESGEEQIFQKSATE